MYTFNRIDQRLQRLMEASIFIFESFAGLDHKYEHLGLANFISLIVTDLVYVFQMFVSAFRTGR